MTIVARKAKLALFAATALAAATLAVAPASAHGHVSVGIGFGFPLFAGPAWGYYDPYYYAPPPVAYYPPPVVYAPRPVYYREPIQAEPTSPVYRDSGGQYCREYQTTVRVGGHYENSYGTACQQPDGSWRVAN
ncbi:hypothetical protein F2P47_15430 [Parvibaculum sedimenti]|uniref:Surface antigen domain-containing protein n=1 Tax=Parvibaculum sedimenti TaxID=2608632 RepID=A0A6N6VHN8_9HYPH|nr:hypothetical protein [Parvibaculum sedimenti]KAB7738827.1 hypothetical protein F2P47_15430 [Parvibaculum sedimenti]